MRSRVYDTSYNAALTTTGDDIYGHASRKPTSDEDFETALRRITETRREKWVAMDGFIKWLKNNDFYSSTSDVWLIVPTIPDDYSAQLIGSNSLTSSGDHTWSKLGISGAGAYYFNTKFNPSTDITDFNNFSIILYVQDDNNSGVDIGASDGSNEVSMSVRSAGQTDMKVGTASDNFTTDNPEGCWVLNVRDGNFRTYQSGVEVGTSTAVSGSAPNFNLWLGCLNTNNTAGSYSSNIYSFLMIYDGRLSEENVEDISTRVEILQTQFNRGYATS